MARPDLTAELVRSAIDADDLGAVVAAFEGASDQDRARVRAVCEIGVAQMLAPRPISQAQLVAFAATASATNLSRQLGWRATEETWPAIAAVVSARTERFRISLARQLLKESFVGWPLVRALVVAGALDPSVDDDGYIRLLGNSITPDRFRTDPALLDREVWRLFEVPGSFSQHNPDGWADAFADLAAGHHRARLIGAVLGALCTDLRPGELGAIRKIAEAIAPTDAELAMHPREVAAMCGAHEAVQKLGIAWLRPVVAAGGIEPAEACEVLRTPLAGSRKQLALDALELLDRFGSATPNAAVVGASGLGHSHVQVRQRAVEVVRRHRGDPPDTAVRAELLRWLDLVPADVRDEVAELTGFDAPVAHVAEVGPPPEVEPVMAPPSELRYEASRQLEPIDDLEQLVSIVAGLLEGQGSGDDFELAIDAIARSAGTRPAGFTDLVSPVRKRADQMLASTFPPALAITTLSAIVLAWADGAAPPRHLLFGIPSGTEPAIMEALLRRHEADTVPTLSRLLRARSIEIAATVAGGGPRTLWATPSHLGGHLDPQVLAARAGSAPTIGREDLRAARLRAAQGTEARSVRTMHLADPPTGSRFRSRVVPLAFVSDDRAAPDDPLLQRAPTAFAPPDPNASRAGRPAPLWDTYAVIDTRVAMTHLSARPDVVAAAGAMRLAERIIQSQEAWFSPGPILELIGDPVVALEGPVLTLAALGVGSEVEFRAVAVDGLIAAVGHHRLDPVALGHELAALHAVGLMPLTRTGPPMVDLASAGPMHRAMAQQILLALVAALEPGVSGVHGPLTALATLAAPGGVRIPATVRPALEALAAKSSQSGKAARSVLAAGIG